LFSSSFALIHYSRLTSCAAFAAAAAVCTPALLASQPYVSCTVEMIKDPQTFIVQPTNSKKGNFKVGPSLSLLSLLTHTGAQV
jgi:hypothetical protein